VAAFANNFYTIGDTRTSERCDISKGHLVGCRAALLNDPSRHFAEALDDSHNPFGHQLFFAKYTGNFELHYFHEADVTEKAGKIIPRSFLLVYWSARFKSNPADQAAPDWAQQNALGGQGLHNRTQQCRSGSA
jgi:hypothetical protein